MRGRYHSYRSDYPNQVHQLNLFISQNYYLLKNDEIKYQEKKFDINWKNFQKSEKRHLVNFLIRDHYSNCFYAEIHSIEKIPDIKDFLFNAWREKKGFEFCGIPKHMIVGRHIIEMFPDILNLTKNIGLNIELAKNGFATGIRAAKEWENNIKHIAYFSQNTNIKDFQDNIEYICRKLNLKDSGKTEPNLIKWANNEPQGYLINDKSKFDNLFIENK